MITRSSTHRIDTIAVREVISQLSPDWLIRGIEERDYGIDMLLEFFSGSHPTGKLALIQIKGKEKKVGKTVILKAFPVKTLLYAEMFSHPFFAFYVSIADKAVYFVWLQSYIKTKIRGQYP